MHRIDSANNATVLPAPLAPVNDPGYFNNNPGASPGTVVSGDFLNSVQEEIAAVVEAASIALDKADNGQLLAAIAKLLKARTPAGKIDIFGGAVAPPGSLFCDGSVVSRAAYADLFAAIGTAFNTGGEAGTDFRLPDLRGRLPLGQDDIGGTPANRVTMAGSNVAAATLGASGGSQFMQEHNHEVQTRSDLSNTTGVVTAVWMSGGGTDTTDNAGAGDSQNMPPVQVVNYIIWT